MVFLHELQKMCCISVMLLLLLVLNLLPVISNQKCSSELSVPKYHLIEKCYRSKLGIAAKANFTAISSCKRLGIARKALALNFSPPGAMKEGVEYSCEVLKCAEADGGLSLANDSAFDYYSIYGKPLPSVNSVCVPSVGMFHQLPRRVNYTEARTMCRNLTGVIPDVTSEQRTDALAQMLTGAGVDAVFAGWRRRNSSSFLGDRGDSLECTTFRAWAPGHPRKNYTKYDCMLITRRKTWLSTPCKKRTKVFCEIIPGGPYRRRSIFASRKHSENGRYQKSSKTYLCRVICKNIVLAAMQCL